MDRFGGKTFGIHRSRFELLFVRPFGPRINNGNHVLHISAQIRVTESR
ncbi:unnamed protein product, partial [Rotaria sp. Silwood2]